MLKKNQLLPLREMILFALLGTIMFCSKLIMEVLPNIHLLGMFTITFTVTFGVKALVPIYVFVMLSGLYAGFAVWWVPYLYIWTLLWAVTMLLPKKMPQKVKWIVYPALCALHGLAYGTLYAPAQTLFFGLNTEQTVAWIVAGLPWDFVHAAGNLLTGTLIFPLSTLLKKALPQPPNTK